MSIQCKKVINIPNNRSEILDAIEILATPVKRTLGPEGLPILLQLEGFSPINTKDGVTVAKSIFIEDQKKDAVIQAIKEAAIKTNKEAGDGTTTAIVLSEAFIKEGFKLIETGIIKPQELSNLMLEKVEEIIEHLQEISRSINTEKEQKFVSLISANGDEKVADKVVEAINRAGEDGVVTIDEGTSTDIDILHVEGFEIPSGYHKLGSCGFEFITHEEKQIAICDNPDILLYNGNFTDVNDFSIFLRDYTKEGKIVPSAFVIIANDFNGEMYKYVLDMRKQHWPIFLLKTVMLGSKTHASRALMLKDLAIFSGGERVPAGAQALFNIIQQENYVDKYIGRCDRVEIKGDRSVFYGGHGSAEDKENHLKALKVQLNELPDQESSEWEKYLVKERIGRICDGVVIIYVGGKTDLEMKEKKDRVEDAYNSTKAAIQEGVVPGGGCALYYISQLLKEETIIDRYFNVVLQYPIKQIYENAGLKTDVILEKLNKYMQDAPEYGYDVLGDCFSKDMFESGIIDPLKVVKSALYNAVSIASQMLISGGIVSFDDYITKKKDKVEI